MQIKKNTVITLNMKVSDQDGNLLEDTPDDEPFVYLHGAQNILPALEDALTGSQAGKTVEVSLPPEKAYGDHDENLVQIMTHDQLEGVGEIEVGDQLDGETEEGIIPLIVTAIDDEGVTVDANHPFAGMTLHFILDITEVRAATSDEVKHGHPHLDGKSCQN